MSTLLLITIYYGFLPNFFRNSSTSVCVLVIFPVTKLAHYRMWYSLFQLRTFTFTIGFSMAFGTLFSKTWRVYRIFSNKKLLRLVRNSELFYTTIRNRRHTVNLITVFTLHIKALGQFVADDILIFFREIKA